MKNIIEMLLILISTLQQRKDKSVLRRLRLKASSFRGVRTVGLASCIGA